MPAVQEGMAESRGVAQWVGGVLALRMGGSGGKRRGGWGG
jgi:hypothetical protein